MALNRVLMPIAFLTAAAFGLATPTDAQAGGVTVKVAPIKVGVDLGAVQISGVIGGNKTPAPRVHKRAPHVKHAAVHVAAHYEWDARARRYVYVPASMKTPPRAGVKYVAGHWSGNGHKKHWVVSHWA